MLAVSDEDKKTAWKKFFEKLLNIKFAWDRNGLSQADIVRDVPPLIEKNMVREMKNGKAAGPSSSVKMVRATREAELK